MGREDDIEKLIAWAESQGWTVRTDGTGYRRFYTPSGDYVGMYPKTPSRPHRRLMDIKSKLKSNGLEIPPPTKAELRRRERQQRNEAE